MGEPPAPPSDPAANAFPRSSPIDRKDSFFGLHFDLHPQATDTALGAVVTDENIRVLLGRVNPDYVQYDCKGHAGWAGYPTSVGWPSPGIVKDSLAVWRQVTREFGIGLFILLPLYATKLLGLFFPGVERSSFLFNFVDGIIRVLIFLCYVLAIGVWKEMARIFMYHGAEHKVIHAYENGLDLTLENVRQYSPLHPRCGTSVLMIVMRMTDP